MLEIKNLSYCYKQGQFAVQDVSLTVKDGEFAAIAGRNGSGKTTLTRLIMSLLKPTGGQILLDGEDTTKNKTAQVAKQIGYVFQNPDRQIFRDTVVSEIAYGPEQLGFSTKEVLQFTEAAMEATGLTSLAKSYPRTLSKGQKQRVAIASALAMQPRMLILDEPTSGQDGNEKLRIMGLLSDLNAAGKAVVIVTHDMELLHRFTRRSIVMAGGSKVFDGRTEELFSSEYDSSAWGLRTPSSVRIAQGLQSSGITPANLPKELGLRKQCKGEERYA